MRRLFIVLAVGAVMTLAPVSASAALMWTLDAIPLTAVANQSTTVIFSATNLLALQGIGCLEVDLPSTFVIEATGTPTATNGRMWVAGVSGNAVVVHSTSGGGRIDPGEAVTFTVQARPTAPGPFLLPNHSHVSHNCNGADDIGLALPITVLPGATLTPVPTPTPRPTPTPTPTPSPLPTLPLPTLPSVLPTAPPPEATPTQPPTHAPVVEASPSGSASPGPVASSPRPSGSPAASRSATPAPFGPSTAGGGPSADGTGASAPQVRLEPADLKLNAELFDLLGSPQVWFVPAAAIGAPGLLVLLWVLLQTIGTLVWIPFVRRMRGQETARSGRQRRVAVR